MMYHQGHASSHLHALFLAVLLVMPMVHVPNAQISMRNPTLQALPVSSAL